MCVCVCVRVYIRVCVCVYTCMCVTCKEHLLLDDISRVRYMKVSKVRDLCWQLMHWTVDLN